MTPPRSRRAREHWESRKHKIERGRPRHVCDFFLLRAPSHRSTSKKQCAQRVQHRHQHASYAHPARIIQDKMRRVYGLSA